jgi:threonine/homoserine/homoserine lactone efflux protein
VASGSLAWGAAAALGLAAVVARSTPVCEAIRLAGAGYLVLLGLAPLLAGLGGRTRRASPVVPLPSGGQPPPPGGVRSAFAVGVMSDLLDPKIALFYVAVMPRFVPPRAPVLQYSMLLCAIDIAVAVTWLGVPTWLAHGAVAWLLRPQVVCWTQRIFSTFLIGLGVSTAVGR